MAERRNSGESLHDQYTDARNISARAQLHARFSTNKHGWCRWVFDQFDLPACCRVLELGCGPGWLWKQNLHRVPPGSEIVLSDFSPGMLANAKDALADADRAFRFEVIDAQAIPFGEEVFDAVIANHMLYHVPDLGKALGEIRRVLKAGGRLYATANGADHMKELRDLVCPLAPDLPFSRNENAKRRFGLDSGAARLAKFSGDVALRRYEDSLQVPAVEPLMAYVLSAQGAGAALTEAAVAELRQRIDERIVAEGVFHVTKSVGMFLATCAPPREGA